MKWLALPARGDGEATGLSDFLVDTAYGPDALRELIGAARPAPRPVLGELRNYDEVEVPAKQEGAEPKIEYLPRSAGDVLTDVYERTDGAYPVTVSSCLYAVADDRLVAMSEATQLFAWLQRLFDNGTPRVKWRSLVGAPTKEEFFAGCLLRARRYDATSAYPHCPPVPTFLYAPFTLAGGDGTALSTLIKFFCPATPVDGFLLTAAFATPFWGGAAGKRPAFLFAPSVESANAGRQTGKSTAATKIVRLYG